MRALVDGTAQLRERDLKLFTLATLELWLRANVDEVRPAPPTWDELL